MSYFCRQNVSQISLKIVANCSHPSEILALMPLLSSAVFSFEIIVFKNIFQEYNQNIKHLDPSHTRHFVETDLVSKCLQKLSEKEY